MVTHPSTDRARRCLTTVIGREPVYSTWCGRNRWNALNNLHLYLSEFWSIPSQPATSQVMWRKCIWVNVESTWNKKGCEWLDNDCFSKAWTKHVRGYLQICRKCQKNIKDYSTRYSQVVTHPSTDRARRCLTTVIGREPVYSTWCGRNRWNALNNLHLYLSEFWSIPSQPATSQVMWRKCIWVNVESTWNKKGCEWLDNDCFSKAWTKHVRGYLQICRKCKKYKRLQHPVFPGGHPSKYWPGPTLLNYGDRTRTGVFNVVWP